MRMTEANGRDVELTRRGFLRSSAVAGAGLVLGRAALAQNATAPAAAPAPAPVPAEPAEKVEEIQVAIIGPGSQGRNLMMNCLKIPGIRFVAVCDIWPYHQEYAVNILGKYEQQAKPYTDYQEMLDKEKNLAAVIIATPDWMHAEQTVTCLKAGKHVYCEKEMSNTLEGCKQMVLAARETKKLLQIGHQRRSNPRYWHAMKMVHQDKILGRITHVYGQWNRSRRLDVGWPKGKEVDEAALKKYGYDNMDRFRNWRWYRKYSGGAIADLGSHQVDIFNWMLKTPPRSVMASGGLDYYPDREWYDNVMAIYEYKTEQGPARAYYQVLNTTSYGGYYEVFMGDEGTLVISEDTDKGFIFREVQAKKRQWEDDASKIQSMGKDAIQLKIGETLTPDGKKDPAGQKLAAEAQKPIHQLHLENFFNAIRKGTPLSCPADVGYETAVTVLKANDAVAAAKTLPFDAQEFKV